MAIAMSAFIAAALLKVSALIEFRDVLVRSWGLAPALADMGAIVIPVAEMTVGACWFLGYARRAAWGAALCLLLLFTAAFVWVWLMRAPPDCGCFGRIRAFESIRHAAMWVVIRNTGLLCLLFVGAWLTATRSAQPRVVPMDGDADAPRLHTH
ncbi:MAG: hypothetical protein KJZ65_09000 [Phycisphaerales bacterium]|nr:hypothetical protein [Phycisphaerales bacterium]